MGDDGRRLDEAKVTFGGDVEGRLRREIFSAVEPMSGRTYASAFLRALSM
jgi:hypothetical protein